MTQQTLQNEMKKSDINDRNYRIDKNDIKRQK